MNIVEAVRDENLFQPFLGDQLESWNNWLVAFRAVYGLAIRKKASRETIVACTGRDPGRLPANGFDTAVFLTGRRSGKSRAAAIIGAFEATLAGHEAKLAKGERGVVPICAPTKSQGRIVKGYLRALFDTDLLRNEIIGDTNEGFELRNGTRIEILAGDWRTIRGFTLLAAIVDEACFFGYDAECKVKSDTELVRAIKPSLATVSGKLVCISSPYAKKGWCYKQWKRHFGNNTSRVLVWNTTSRVMNPTLPQSVVDEALAEDLQSARSEYLGEFRDDIAEFLPRHLIDALVVKGRLELMPEHGQHYSAFADLSGGRNDAASLAVAHKAGPNVVLDVVRHYQPPFNPNSIIGDMANELRRFSVRRVIGDNYAAEFVAQAFGGHGLRYTKCDKPKSILYAELLPRLCSGEIELLDNETLVAQLSSLERRTRSGGRDIIDHPPGGHDDLANAVAGVADIAAIARRVVGIF